MIHFFLHSSLFFIRKIINRLIYLSYNIIYLHIHAWSKGKNIIPHKLDKCVSRKMKGWNLLLRIFRYSFAEVVKCFQGRKRSIHRRNGHVWHIDKAKKKRNTVIVQASYPLYYTLISVTFIFREKIFNFKTLR